MGFKNTVEGETPVHSTMRDTSFGDSLVLESSSQVFGCSMWEGRTAELFLVQASE